MLTSSPINLKEATANRKKSVRENSKSNLIMLMIDDSNKFLNQFGARPIYFEIAKK